MGQDFMDIQYDGKPKDNTFHDKIREKSEIISQLRN